MTLLPADITAWVRHATGATPVLRVEVLGMRSAQPHVVALYPARGRRPIAVLKRYDRSVGGRTAAAMRALHRTLAHLDDPALAVPEVRHWDPRRGVLTQAPAPGAPLLPLLESARRPEALRAVARALACLHASSARIGRVTTMADHLADLVRPASGHIGDVLPALQPRIDAVVAALIAWDRTRPPVAPVPVHRDAHARQMFLTGRQVCLVDWDLAARGDAALDVANFAMYLRTHLSRDADDAATVFLDAYAAHGTELSARLPPFIAMTCVRLLCKAHRLRPAGWRTRVGQLLRHAERAL